MDRVREKLISPGYDSSKVFVDASNLHTFMEKNDIASSYDYDNLNRKPMV